MGTPMVICEMCGVDVTARMAPPDAALPPLPEKWESYPFHDITAGDMVRFRIKGTTFGIDVYDDSVEVADFTGVFDSPADWSLILRHAEAAQQQLKEGQ